MKKYFILIIAFNIQLLLASEEILKVYAVKGEPNYLNSSNIPMPVLKDFEVKDDTSIALKKGYVILKDQLNNRFKIGKYSHVRFYLTKDNQKIIELLDGHLSFKIKNNNSNYLIKTRNSNIEKINGKGLLIYNPFLNQSSLWLKKGELNLLSIFPNELIEHPISKNEFGIITGNHNPTYKNIGTLSKSKVNVLLKSYKNYE